MPKCKRCKRTLKNQPWIDLGFGRVCAAKFGITVPTKTYAKVSLRASPKNRKAKTPSNNLQMSISDINEEEEIEVEISTNKEAASVGERI